MWPFARTKHLFRLTERARWPLLTVCFVALLLGCVLVFPALIVDRALRPEQSLTPAERVKAENDARTTLLQGVAGLLLLVGAIATWRQLRLSREGQITERFTKAIDQLDYGKSLEVRLGAIYALERIARDSERDHWPIMEVLTTYVRQHAAWKPQKDQFKPLAPDIQAILTVLGRRARTFEKGEDQRLNFVGMDLWGVMLGEAHLEGANLWKAHLENAGLAESHLEGANLREAHLEGADLREAHLENAALGKAYLEGARLWGAHLKGADLWKAHLKGADLWKAHLENAGLGEAHLEGARLAEAHLEGARLGEAHLEGASLWGAHLEGADLREAHLQGALLWEGHLERADLRKAHLEGADLREAHLEGADLREVRLEGADLSRAMGLTKPQIDSAFTDKNTKLPDDLASTRPT